MLHILLLALPVDSLFLVLSVSCASKFMFVNIYVS